MGGALTPVDCVSDNLKKKDNDRDTVRDGIAKILAHKRTEPVFIDQDRAKEIIDKSTEEYQARVQDLDRRHHDGVGTRAQTT